MIDDIKPDSPDMSGRRARSRTFSEIVDGFTITTIVLIFIAVAMLYLTNISVNMDMSWKDFGYEAVILYIFTVAINLLSRSVTKRKGRDTEAHRAAEELVCARESEIISKGLRGREREYCRSWETQELRDARKKVLASANIDTAMFENTYLKYSAKELKSKREEFRLTEFQIKVIGKAKRIRRLRYDERYLSAGVGVGRRLSPAAEINTKRYERLRTVQYLITAFAGVCVSASIALDIISDPSFGTVVMCIVKIMTILISAVSGMLGGYKLTAEMETAELRRKAAEQQNFIVWCGKDTNANEKDGNSKGKDDEVNKENDKEKDG